MLLSPLAFHGSIRWPNTRKPQQHSPFPPTNRIGMASRTCESTPARRSSLTSLELWASLEDAVLVGGLKEMWIDERIDNRHHITCTTL